MLGSTNPEQLKKKLKWKIISLNDKTVGSVISLLDRLKSCWKLDQSEQVLRMYLLLQGSCIDVTSGVASFTKLIRCRLVHKI